MMTVLPVKYAYTLFDLTECLHMIVLALVVIHIDTEKKENIHIVKIDAYIA